MKPEETAGGNLHVAPIGIKHVNVKHLSMQVCIYIYMCVCTPTCEYSHMGFRA